MRLPGWFLLLALAAGVVHADDDDATRVVREQFQSREWDALPPWRQSMLVERYRELMALPAADRKQRLKGRNLRDYLYKPHRRFDRRKFLPKLLQDQLAKFDGSVKKVATRFALLRLRHHRRDRGLRLVPLEQRWDLFRRLYPEPFSKHAAHTAHKELKLAVVRDMAAKVRAKKENAKLSDEAARRILRELIEKEETAVATRVARELGRFLRMPPERALQELTTDFYSDKMASLTPRQSELVRYAYRPHDCPLLDLSFLGERPKDRRDRRAWDRDFHILARLELLAEAGLPREMILHLANTGGPHDFVRALRALRGDGSPLDGPDGKTRSGGATGAGDAGARGDRTDKRRRRK